MGPESCERLILALSGGGAWTMHDICDKLLLHARQRAVERPRISPRCRWHHHALTRQFQAIGGVLSAIV